MGYWLNQKWMLWLVMHYVNWSAAQSEQQKKNSPVLWKSRLYQLSMNSVADPGFLRERVSTPSRRQQTFWPIFPKTAWKWNNFLSREEGSVPIPPRSPTGDTISTNWVCEWFCIIMPCLLSERSLFYCYEHNIWPFWTSGNMDSVSERHSGSWVCFTKMATRFAKGQH